MKTILSILFTTIVFIACSQNTTKTDSIWKTLTEAEYSIEYPQEWTINTSGQLGTEFMIFSPLDSKDDKFMENVNLIIQILNGMNINLDKYTEISLGQIKTMITNSDIIENKRIKIDGKDCQKIIYSGNQGTYKLMFEQYYWVENEKAYVLTFTTEIDKFDNYKDTGEKILNTFKIK